MEYDANLIYALAVGHISGEIPKTFKEAQDIDWQDAIKEELEVLKENNTWTLVEPPPEAVIINSKWVFTEKVINNKVKKTRLVARGFLQPMDEEECYAPVARMVTMRILLSLAVEHDLSIHQLDVKSAFLKSKLENVVFMKPPVGLQGYSEGQVSKLEKDLYGLR